MKILVTGALGFIGHHLVNRLKKHGHQIFCVDFLRNCENIDIGQYEQLINMRRKSLGSSINHAYDVNSSSLEYAFSTFKPEVVIHLASFSRQHAVATNPIMAAHTMSTGLVNICELSKKYETERVVYVSSSMVYGNFSHGVTEEDTCSPINLYGVLKLSGEQIVQHYSSIGAFNYTIIRPSAVYGHNDTPNRVLSMFMQQALAAGTLFVRGEDQSLDFTYVLDLVNGIVKCIESPNTINKTYNITRGHAETILTAAKTLIEIIGKGKIVCIEKEPTMPTRGTLSISKAERDFGYKPVFSLYDGLVDWYKHLENVK